MPFQFSLQKKEAVTLVIFILFVPRYSRKIMWIDVSTTNNNPNVILGLYMKAVLEIGGSAAFSASSSGSV